MHALRLAAPKILGFVQRADTNLPVHGLLFQREVLTMFACLQLVVPAAVRMYATGGACCCLIWLGNHDE